MLVHIPIEINNLVIALIWSHPVIYILLEDNLFMYLYDTCFKEPSLIGYVIEIIYEQNVLEIKLAAQ